MGEMIRLQAAITQLRCAQRDMMAVTARVQADLQACQNRLEDIITGLEGEQAEYRAKAERDGNDLFGDRAERDGTAWKEKKETK